MTRIYLLAREFGVEPTELVNACKQLGIAGKLSSLASLNDSEVSQLRQWRQGSNNQKVVEPETVFFINDHNPFTNKVIEFGLEHDGLRVEAERIQNELRWYYDTDRSALEKNLAQNTDRVKQLRAAVEASDRAILEDCNRIKELRSKAGSLLNPMNWFDKEQREIRQKIEAADKARINKVTTKRTQTAEIELVEKQIESMTCSLKRYHDFDCNAHEHELLKIQQALVETESELKSAEIQRQELYGRINPIVGQLNAVESQIKGIQSEIHAANEMEAELSSGNNSYQRAMIHRNCEARFGNGSPGKVIGQKKALLQKLECDREKIQRRLNEITRRSARTIETLVIDGNNLCYEGSKFIGLQALEAVIPLMAEQYAPILVFDASIRRLLGTDSTKLQSQFGALAKVHIVASRQMADETLLDLASEDEATYILSNDRFIDFSEKPAVMAGRLIRHEIVNGRVFVHDLHLNATY